MSLGLSQNHEERVLTKHLMAFRESIAKTLPLGLGILILSSGILGCYHSQIHARTQIIREGDYITYSIAEPYKEKCNKPSEVDFHLPQAQEMAGDFLDSSGSAAAEVEVELRSTSSRLRVTTDWRGHYTFGTVASGDYRFFVDKGRFLAPTIKCSDSHCEVERYLRIKCSELVESDEHKSF